MTFFAILFGASGKPPLYRRDFLKAAAFVFFVRLPVASVLQLLVFHFSGIDLRNESLLSWPIVSGLLISCIFMIPYCRVMHRRFAGIGLFYAGSLVVFIMACLVIVLGFLPESEMWCDFLRSEFVFIVPYLLLLPWKDRPLQITQ